MGGWDQNGYFGEYGVDSLSSGKGELAGSCEHGNETLSPSVTELVS
jgi:hypothetical protein